MHDACESMLSLTVADPEKLKINERQARSRDMPQHEALEFLSNQGRTRLTESQVKSLELQYGPGETSPKQHFITIDYTDRSRLSPVRGEAICIFYEDRLGTKFYAAHLAGRVAPSSPEQFFDFTVQYGTPKNMTMLGDLKP